MFKLNQVAKHHRRQAHLSAQLQKKEKVMAVTPRTAEYWDTKSKKMIEVHSVQLNKSNKKGVAELIDGKVIDTPAGFRVDFRTKVSDKSVLIMAVRNDRIFRTGKNKRWQVLDTAGFNKRFKLSKP